MTFLPLLALLLSCSNVKAQLTSVPPAVPLAVRSPYLNCWLQNATFGQTWPTTFNHSQILGWSVLVRVDGLTYSFLGDVLPSLHNGTADFTSIAITPTQTVVTARAGPMQVNLTFLNPIEPGDWVKQSIPFSYMAFTANSLDGASHAVQVYSDVSGEWNSGDRSQTIQWNSTPNADVIFHRVTLQAPALFTEIIDQAEWGTLYYAMKAGENVTYQIASDSDSRGNFTRNGVLNGQQDTKSRAISDHFAVFAISRDLGTVEATQAPVVWTVGYTTDPTINYTDLSGAPPISRSLYYKTQYPDDESLIVDFLNDFSNASSRAQELDNKILQDANSVSDRLGDLVSLATAQVYGSMQLTIGTDAHGNLNNSDAMMFMKNIGGFGANRVNAVETLYAAFPALMYIDPSLGVPLLEPLFRLQASRNYPTTSSAADLGPNYPSVSGSNSNHSQGVEQTGNMLIMAYAYARAIGDRSVISRYYSLLSSWADYLNTSTLVITDQSSADNSSIINPTNLAIKGIIAIQAMSKMASVVNRTDDVYRYTNAAANLYALWKSLALSSDQHLLAAYGKTDSWTLGYNLFADVWLGTDLVDLSVHNGHSNFIYNLMLNSNLSKFGMPVDNAVPADTSVAVSSWSLFVAAMTTSEGLRSELISRVHHRAISVIPGVFPVYYDSSNGTSLRGMASPAQGAVFAPLALNVDSDIESLFVVSPTSLASSGTRNKKVGTIVEVIIGGVAAISVMIGIIVTLLKRQRRRKLKLNRPRSISSFSTDSASLQAGPWMIVTPFDPSFPEGTQDSEVTTQQQPLETGVPDAETLALLPISRPVAPVPVGLSDKELARLRADALTSQQVDNPRGSTSNVFRLTFSPTAVAETGGAALPYDTRRLCSEVESLRREMEQLRAEGSVVAAPPSYMEGNG